MPINVSKVPKIVFFCKRSSAWVKAFCSARFASTTESLFSIIVNWLEENPLSGISSPPANCGSSSPGLNESSAKASSKVSMRGAVSCGLIIFDPPFGSSPITNSDEDFDFKKDKEREALSTSHL